MKSNWGFTTTGHFPYHCLISYNMEQAVLSKTLKRKKYAGWSEFVDESTDQFDGRNWAVRQGKYFMIVLCNNVTLTDEGYLTIAHECLHIVQFVSKYVCADMIEEKESSPYLLEHVMRACIKVIREAR